VARVEAGCELPVGIETAVDDLGDLRPLRAVRDRGASDDLCVVEGSGCGLWPVACGLSALT